MPSFMTEGNKPFFSQPGSVIDVSSDHRHLAVSAKDPRSAHVNTHKLSPAHIRNESFAESSSHSTSSDLTDPSHPNGDATRPTSMSSIANGKTTRGASVSTADESDVSPADLFSHLNGTTEPAQHPAKPDCATFVMPPTPAVASPEAPTREPPPAPQASPAMMNGGSSTSPAATGSSSSASRDTGKLSHLETIPYGSSSLSGAGTVTKQEERHEIYSSHRFTYPAENLANGSASASMPALQPPHGASLKHRHTLEVPKVTPGRPSRDGAESAYASSHFSPTGTARRASLNLGRRNTRSLHSDMVRDEVVPDEDALRWAEAYRQKRAKKKQIEDDDRVLVGTKVDENHQNWVTAYNMLTGIRVSVSRTNAKLDREITDADFHAKQKSTFDIAGNELVPSAKYDFKFKDYAPWVFRTLRNKFKLDPADYLMSLTGKYILSELGSPGKSGSFFYFSRDYKYIIKTIHHAEHKFLRKILKDYYQHVLNNPNTLLSQFYGLHRVKMPWGKKIHFVVMNNLFPPHRDIHMTFDLKGSTIGRDYLEEDIENNPRATLKDLNWMRRKRTLELGIQKKRLFLEQLQRDVRLLQRLEIMDYSLLIGIHDLQRGNDENLRDKTLKVFNPGGEDQDPAADPHTILMRTPSKLENEKKARELRQMIKSEKPIPVGMTADKMPNTLDEPRKHSLFYSEDGGFGATHENNAPADEIYYLGVIDCLTHYGMIKKIEHFWKGLSSDRTQISALPPQEYGERFYSFVEGVTMSQEEAAMAQVAQEKAEVVAPVAGERERVASWNSEMRKRASQDVPPVPTHKPPPPPPPPPGSNNAAQALDAECYNADTEGSSKNDVPDRTVKRRDSPNAGQAILPVVEEAPESSVSGRSRAGSSGRPISRDRDGMEAPDRPPPTPPKGKPDNSLKNVDSGYSGRLKSEPGRESLDKALPPLPLAGA